MAAILIFKMARNHTRLNVTMKFVDLKIKNVGSKVTSALEKNAKSYEIVPNLKSRSFTWVPSKSLDI